MIKQIATLDDKLKKYECLSNNTIKIIAVIAMIIDHLAKIVLTMGVFNVLFPQMEAGVISHDQYQNIDNFVRFTLPSIGRIAFPLFCFLLVEGYRHTRNKKKYLTLMVIFAFVSELPFDIAFFHTLSIKIETFPFYWGYQNVFFTLVLGIILLMILQEIKKKFPFAEKRILCVIAHIVSVGAITIIADLIKADYGSMGILYIFAFYLFRNSRILQALSILAVYGIATGNQPTLFLMLSSIVILFYNGNHGKLNLKYFFYLFYPVHIALLFIIALFLGFIDLAV